MNMFFYIMIFKLRSTKILFMFNKNKFINSEKFIKYLN